MYQKTGRARGKIVIEMVEPTVQGENVSFRGRGKKENSYISPVFLFAGSKFARFLWVLQKYQEMKCKNCAHLVDYNFCPNCGQSSTVGRINPANFLAELSDSVFQVNRGLFFTIR